MSEIILQQTRVAQGLPYYENFMAAFPTVQDLASSPIDDVLRLWQGLGYYSRARNLHKCAEMVVQVFGGSFPKTAKELQKLPGIGPYTSAAIASIAYNEKIPVIDGNVYRVLSRVFDIETDIASHGAYTKFMQYASQLIPEEAPANFNQAMMELGATVCTPTQPKCIDCPLGHLCLAKRRETVHLRPVKTKKINVRERHFNYIIFEFENFVLMRKRTGSDIWNGLYEFYKIEGDLSETAVLELLTHHLNSSVMESLTLIETSKVYKHLLTHQKLWVKFYRFKLTESNILEKIGKILHMQIVDHAIFETLGKPIILEKYWRN